MGIAIAITIVITISIAIAIAISIAIAIAVAIAIAIASAFAQVRIMPPPYTAYVAMDERTAAKVRKTNALDRRDFKTMGRWISCRWHVRSAVQLATSVEHNNPESNPWQHLEHFEILKIVWDYAFIEEEQTKSTWTNETIYWVSKKAIKLNTRQFSLSSDGVISYFWEACGEMA